MAIERVSLRNDGEVTFPLNDHCPPSQSLINVGENDSKVPSVTLFQLAGYCAGIKSSVYGKETAPRHRSQLESNQGFFHTLL